MKKLAQFFSALLLIFTSCSSDDAAVSEPELTTNGFVLKKAISTNGSNVTTEEYFYNGNKIEKIVISNGNRIEFTYAENVITKMDYFENNVLKISDYFQYNSLQKMIERKSFDFSNNHGYRCDFIYNLDGTVTIKGYTGDFTTQSTQIVDRKVFLFNNGDVEKIEEYTTSNGILVTKTNYYTYDDKNSPSNFALGYNKIKFWDTGTYGNSHNNTSILYTTTENTTTYRNDLLYTYNSYEYPITASYLGISIQYFYQQP